ncbi:GNAT domain containing protein [uncultured Caudovirales phage]|uniref:GNAT domain containing protein n=1 Tax=uncultured Caudovirales phage TaxID=2100421 RepID=A0A6J5KIP3_9CAUD|nr:GNAT domain containing protein [uncultured Caudovirales phage]
MIRQATKHDKPQIIELMKLFRAESNIKQYQGLDNEPYWNRLLDTILAGAGIIYIEDGVGLIMGLISPTIWCDKTLYMQELAWYVTPQKRNTSVGYRLLKKYIEYGNELKSQGRIKMFAIAKMISSPDVKYQKFGFTKLDENWIQ